MKRKLTMQDIADKLNISKNSVSQALSGKDGVSEETRNLIQKTADEMGYMYPQSRKLKIKKGTGNIALIASDFAFSQTNFFGEIYLTIERETALRGMNLHIQSISQEAIDQLILPSFLENQNVDGILILSHIDTEYTKKVISTGIPVVLIDHHHPRIYADSILTNNRFGAFDAVQYLLDLGHHDIGFMGDIHFSPSYYERLEGYTMAMKERGITPNPHFIINDAVEQGDVILQRLVNLPVQPTAWFCVNDGLGFLINAAIQQMGLKIPEDISICSFDNGQLSRIATPSTTSMAIDLKLYGKKAIEQLFWRMNHKDEPFMETLLPTTLIERESTAQLRPR
ncbi:substrate-binding domain-containing protein [Paenibacillus sp. IHBB 10380]|uniref:substrate-binding domain-containing protein n=1 Tax=Paenibacillus sp. IHBB 10380 TaxID=1566358 RepID=UPI0005CFC14F|nr:substrate-binding domain-containing protein [Paenibacillus sp. IHBB 10380]AJS61743.1 LacI family transcriptional regulator [Paenibacillus sp. IHBB 10380]